MRASAVRTRVQPEGVPHAGPQLSGSCQGPSCAQAHYQTGHWSACNATCGGGVAMRTVACVDAKLQPVHPDACKGLTVPAAQQTCNTAPCVGHTWQVSDFACAMTWIRISDTARIERAHDVSPDWLHSRRHTAGSCALQVKIAAIAADHAEPARECAVHQM